MRLSNSIVSKSVATAGMGTLLLASVLTCKADYPSCESDRDCRDKEVCVARKCQQCGQASDCPIGQTCNDGKCAAIVGYCRINAECAEGKLCINNQCRLCGDDNECPPDTICHGGACKSAKRCASDQECAQGEDCIDGICVAPSAPPAPAASCKPPTLFFDFNEAALTIKAKGQLVEAKGCLNEMPGGARAIGHADPRGTQEYNVVLSERRARAVRDELERLGIPPSKITLLPRGSLDATGTDEVSWVNDRRVELQPP